MHRDLLYQAYSAMRHDLRRTLLTMAGMAWGIATVVLLLSYGNGFGKAVETIFESFGATAVGVFPGRTSQQAGGNKAGVQVRFTNDDIELLRNNVPLCRHVVRESDKQSTVQNENRSFSFPVMGLDPSIQAIWNLDIEQGRFLDDADNMQHGLYAVIASEARDKLFSGMPAVGESIRIDGVTFEVIGVGAPRMQEGDNDNNRVIYIPYNSMDVLKDNHYLEPIPAADTRKEGFVDRWIVYGKINGEQLFTAKELTIDPGAKSVIKDNGAYGLTVVQGKGRMNKLRLDCPKMIRFHELTEDEVFCSEPAARAGVIFENTSEVEPLVVLRYFGPDVNPEAPDLGPYRKNKF